MAPRLRVRPGRRLALMLAIAVFATALTGSTAFAADNTADTLDFEEVFLTLQNTPVYKDACTKTCHGNIAKTKNYASEITFQHGYHQLVACSSCHPRFPHRADTTIERPTMKGCFDCHGVRHGPMGLLASGECEDCHATPRARLRPAFHTPDWRGQPHVAPAEKEFNTRCAMCHDEPSCDECHQREGINWVPAGGWDYNAEDGCLACHGNAALTKQSSSGAQSFMVTGIDASAHSDNSCQQCHIDYRYDDAPAPTQSWQINVSVACANCHKASDDEAMSAPVPLYENSVHAEKIAEGEYDSATCGSCHGGHFIYRLDTPVAKARMHQSAFRVCARCKQHGEDYDTYDDYYHGAAYKEGAPDAPACWDCHNAHDVLPKADASSTVNPSNVGDTCGREGCHTGSSDQFGAQAATLIHEKSGEVESNPIMRLISSIRGQ